MRFTFPSSRSRYRHCTNAEPGVVATLPSSATTFSRLSSLSRASRAPVPEDTNFRNAPQTLYLFRIRAKQSSRTDHLSRTMTLNLPSPSVSSSSSSSTSSSLSDFPSQPLFCKLPVRETIHVLCSCLFLCSDRIFPSHGTPCLSLFTLARPVSSLALFFFSSAPSQ